MHGFLRLRRRRDEGAMSCPPRRSFVACDARRRGQLGIDINCRQSTYRPASGVQTTGATSVSSQWRTMWFHIDECDLVATNVVSFAGNVV